MTDYSQAMGKFLDKLKEIYKKIPDEINKPRKAKTIPEAVRADLETLFQISDSMDILLNKEYKDLTAEKRQERLDAEDLKPIFSRIDIQDLCKTMEYLSDTLQAGQLPEIAKYAFQFAYIHERLEQQRAKREQRVTTALSKHKINLEAGWEKHNNTLCSKSINRQLFDRLTGKIRNLEKQYTFSKKDWDAAATISNFASKLEIAAKKYFQGKGSLSAFQNDCKEAFSSLERTSFYNKAPKNLTQFFLDIKKSIMTFLFGERPQLPNSKRKSVKKINKIQRKVDQLFSNTQNKKIVLPFFGRKKVLPKDTAALSAQKKPTCS